MPPLPKLADLTAEFRRNRKPSPLPMSLVARKNFLLLFYKKEVLPPHV